METAQLINISNKKQKIYDNLAQSESVFDLSLKITDIIRDNGFTDYALVNIDYPFNAANKLTTFSHELRESLHELTLKSNIYIEHAKLSNKYFYASYVSSQLLEVPIGCNTFNIMHQIDNAYSSHEYYDLLYIPLYQEYLLILGAKTLQSDVFRSKFMNSILFMAYMGHTAAILIEEKFLEATVPIIKSKLTPSQKRKPAALRALQKFADNDFTMEELAKEVCIAGSTLNHHFRQLRDQLGVKHNHMLVKKAIQKGLIDWHE